jgi:hypothetical protein
MKLIMEIRQIPGLLLRDRKSFQAGYCLIKLHLVHTSNLTNLTI